MTRLTIVHETRYSYERPVSFGPHRLLLRPRDSHAIRVVDASLGLSPHGETRWVYDALGNSLCWFTPQGQATELAVTSRLVIERYPAPLAPFRPDDPHTASPIVYAAEDRRVLAPFIAGAAARISGIETVWNTRKVPKMPSMKPKSPTRLTTNALIAAALALGLRNQKPISR